MTTISRITSASFLILLLTLPSMAQAQNLPQDLSLISITNAMALDVGRLYRFSTWPDYPPLPPTVLLNNPYLQAEAGDLSAKLFYSPSLDSFFWDEREMVAAQMLAAAASNESPQMLEQQQQGEELGAQGPYGTNDFYLEPVSVVSNLFNAILHNTTNGSTYIINSTEAIDPVTNCVWLVEGSLQGGTNDATPFALGIALRTNNLFISAQACDECATNTLPLWWQLAYFGVTGVDPNGDYDGDGVTNLVEFLNSTDPNKIVFSLSVTNEYVATTAVPVQVNIVGGVPSYIALLLNDDSPTNATWQPFTSTSLSVSLPTNGTYVITVGLCGLATNATQSWQSLTVFRDTTPLTLGLTNLSSLSGSRPFIDPAGYATRPLSALTWTVVDANGDTNTGNGMVVAQGWSLADPYHVTNWFQCVDLPLALGTNWISIQALDWSGTVAVTNFAYVFDTNGDTTAPALTLAWPQDGTQVSGTNFTVQAWMDDDTAAVALQYIDGDAILQTVNGLVERGGNVWVPDVPLATGTNGFSLLATDAAGNVSTNNFTVVQSSVELVIYELSEDDMKYAYATVWGEVDDPDCTITVNGVEGINYGNGSWVVDNVLLPLGGSVVLQATAQFDAPSRPSENRELPATAQSGGAATVETLLKQQPAPIVFTHKYGYKLDYTLSPSTNTFEGHHFELRWARGIGGTNTEASWTVDPDGNVSSNLFIAVWPPDNGFVPTLDATTWSASYWNGVLTNSITWTADPPSVQWMEQSTSTGSWPNYYQASWTESSTREVRLYTGGSAMRKKQGLFDLSASLTYQSVLDTNRLGNWSVLYWPQAFTAFLSPASTPVGVPPQLIALGAQGKLGNDGHLWSVLPDGYEAPITPKAPGKAYVGQLPSQQKYTLHIDANGNPLGANHVPPSANFCVGQKLTFSQRFTPTLPEQTQVGPIKWTLSGQYINDGTNVVPGGTFPNSSTNFFVNPDRRTNETTAAWWVSGGFSPPKPESAILAEGLTFANGQYVVLASRGKFTMHRPKISFYLAETNGAQLAHNLLQGNSYLRAEPPATFGAYIDTAFDGQIGVTQLINGYATNASLFISTSGTNQLDNSLFVTDSLRNAGANSTTNLTSIADGPQIICNSNTVLHFDFLDYIRFKPGAGEGNIFITLGTTKWHVYAATQLVPVPGTTDFDYSPLPPPMFLPADPGDADIDKSPADSTAFPRWANVLTNLYTQ